jgi:outer membrane protein TolC
LADIAIGALPPPETYDLGALRDMALMNRLTVRHALADYAVTEQALRLAVARQYPDVTVGPGYSYDRGDHAITLAISAIVPLLHDESDVIAQAVDVRSRAAAQFQQAQSLVLGEIDSATARYRAAYSTLPETGNAEDIARRGVEETQRRLATGGADRGEVLTSEIGLALAQRAGFDALRTVADALGALEDAVQRPIFPPSTLAVRRPGDPTSEPMP